MALFGVSIQVGVIMVEYINQLRVRGYSIIDAATQGASRRLTPIMMKMLVATLGLLPAATSHAIGSDSQRPFAIVIVGGLASDLFFSHFLSAYVLRLAGATHRPPTQGRGGEGRRCHGRRSRGQTRSPQDKNSEIQIEDHSDRRLWS
jgi:Cu/Ag efflux pump CusA